MNTARGCMNFDEFTADLRAREATRWRMGVDDPMDRERYYRRAWEEHLERRVAHAKRVHRAFRDALPARAFEAAMTGRHTAAIAAVAAWQATLGDDGGIAVVSGSVGVGKTVSAAWWALQLVEPPLFMRATGLASASRYDQEARAERFGAGAMVLDDLGSEYLDVKGSFCVDLDELIDVKYAQRGRLLVTTNLTRDAFKERYGARIWDRLREAGRWISVVGPSLRGEP